ncbi:MAG: SIMPL domain-containing protein, partial [Ginsengibacter sp.]
MRLPVLFFLIFLSACSSVDKPKTIRVAGEGKVRVMPDIVTLTIDISFVKPRMVDAVRETQQTVDSVVAILEHFGKKNTD